MIPTAAYPCYRAIADQALLVEFGQAFSAQTHDGVISLDYKLRKNPFVGFTEAVPAYVSLLVCFNASITDHGQVEAAINALLHAPDPPPRKGRHHDVDICFDADFSPDLAEIARLAGLRERDVIEAQLDQTYQVIMYGFAPGYAYLAGVPPALHLPRKPTAKRGVPAGSVIIAGAQCLITTLTMPTGWWIIGRSPAVILQKDPAKPYLFDVGDRVQFNRIDRKTFDTQVSPR